MTFRVVIPARLGSTRLPGKALAAIGGKPMVVRVAERASDSGASEVWVATDSQQIVETVRGHGFKAVMTRSDHVSGTDRIAEVAARFGWPDDAVVVNVQGDEPLINPDLIASVAALLPPGEAASMATAAYPISRVQEFLDPNAVKVVLDRQGYAAYFSRAPIPWPRDAGLSGGEPAVEDAVLPRETQALRHVGLYAYRSAFLRSIPHLQSSPHETAESLEQLRVIWNGFRIRVVVTDHEPEPGVDTPEDLRRVRERFERS